MNASAFVGRVGGLSVALGIGAAITVGCAGAAWADSADSSSMPSKGSAAQRSPVSPRTGNPAPTHARAVAAATRTPTAASSTGRAVKAKASAANTNTVTALFFNETPSVNWTANPGQSRNGVVTGNVVGTDGEGDPIRYTVTSAPVNGSVMIDADGSYTYTPSDSLAYVGSVDTFTVTGSDAGAGFHIHGIGGLLNLLTFGLLGVSGHTSTVTVPVNVVAWRRYNTAPTATATVGAADPKTGTVLGQVIGTDPDDDLLAYSAAGSTAKGTVTIDAGTGAFTYIPNVAARGMNSSTDIITVTVADGYGGSTPIAVSVPVAAWNAVNPMVRYAFNFTSGSQYWTAEALSALQFAADKLASYIVVAEPVVLSFDVTAYSSPELDTLASAGSGIRGWGAGYYYTVVQYKLLKGYDLNQSAADGTIDVNFAKSWSYADTVGSDQHDFVSAMMHEMMHAYGVTSYLEQAGYNTDVAWPLFDSAIVDWNGTSVINDSYRFDTAFNPNLTGGNGGLYFAGNHAATAYGGLVPLFTPDPWDAGSSTSHLDDYSFWGSDSQLMNAMQDSGPGVRVLSPVERGILMDLGYIVSVPA